MAQAAWTKEAQEALEEEQKRLDQDSTGRASRGLTSSLGTQGEPMGGPW